MDRAKGCAFLYLKFLLKSSGISSIDGGILFDLGVSSMQIDNADRGFSFKNDGPLDMSMEENGETAADFLNNQNEKKISDVIFKYGEEGSSRKIARAIRNYKKNV